MALITNIKDLERYTLYQYDHVEFNIDGKTMVYEVMSDHLMGIGISNNKIFEELGFSSIGQKQAYVSSIYGYQAVGGSWPTCKDGDYVGLTKLVKALYELVDKKAAYERAKQSPFTPLEITKTDQPQDPVESKVRIPKIKIKHIKSEINSKLKLIK